MKSFRRNRSTYLRASSTSSVNDESSVEELIDGQLQLRRRCGALLVESMRKLKCGSNPKGITLMSQSELSLDRHEHRNGYLNPPSIDPISIYPSLDLTDESWRYRTATPLKGRCCEDNASDDALEAPRRFLQPSNLQKAKISKHQPMKHPTTYIMDESSNEFLEAHEYPKELKVDSPLSGIPACVLVPRTSCGSGWSNDDNSDHGSGLYHLHVEDYNAVNVAIDTGIDPYNERLFYKQHYGLENCAVLGEPKIEELPFWNASCEGSSLADVLDKNDQLRNELHSELNRTTYDEYDCLEFPDVNSIKVDIRVLPTADNGITPTDIPSQNSNGSRNFPTNFDEAPKQSRTFILASPSVVTAKTSSLSKKFATDERKIQLQASDTSFATTKSGATFATSHSTSTGISRSSRKTQELICRYERSSLHNAS
jgi:hypothetical protein